MKHSAIVITILLAISLVFPCNAQFEKYASVHENIWITTKPNILIYELPLELYNLQTSQRTKTREFIETSHLNTKKIKNQTQMRVVRYTNTLKILKLNAYIVAFKDRLWIIKECDVEDNTLIRERNQQMLEDYGNMTANLQILTNRKDSIYNYHIDIAKDSIIFYKNLQLKLPSIRDSLIINAQIIERDKIDSIYKLWYANQPESTKKATKVIKIKQSLLNSPNNVGGCDYKLQYINRAVKTIKYLYWTGTIYNRVDDPVYCVIRRTAKFQGKDVGPINSNEIGGGTWECIIYNNEASYITLNEIDIIYIDGSTIKIAESDIKRMLTEPSNDTKVDTYAIITSVMSDVECQRRINKWEQRIRTLENKKCTTLVLDEYLSNYVYPQAEIIESAIKELEFNRNLFERFLNFYSYRNVYYQQ